MSYGESEFMICPFHYASIECVPYERVFLLQGYISGVITFYNVSLLIRFAEPSFFYKFDSYFKSDIIDRAPLLGLLLSLHDIPHDRATVVRHARWSRVLRTEERHAPNDRSRH